MRRQLPLGGGPQRAALAERSDEFGSGRRLPDRSDPWGPSGFSARGPVTPTNSQRDDRRTLPF